MAGGSVDAYRLETQATVNGVTVKVAKWLGITIGATDYITLNSLLQQPPNERVFDDAIYSYGDLKFGQGCGASQAQVTGGITYEGNLTNGDNEYPAVCLTIRLLRQPYLRFRSLHPFCRSIRIRFRQRDPCCL
jgi:hypothetical protein